MGECTVYYCNLITDPPTCEVHMLSQPRDARGKLDRDEETHGPGAEKQERDHLMNGYQRTESLTRTLSPVTTRSRVLRTQPVSETRIRTAGLSLLEISTPENLNYDIIIMIVRCNECLPANKEADEVDCVKQSRLKICFRELLFSFNFIIFLPSLVEEHAAHRDRMWIFD